MPRAAILTFDECYASSVGGFADILQVANSHLRRQQGTAAAQFEWRFVSSSGNPIVASNGLQLQTHKLEPRERYDLVFIPSLHYGGQGQFDQILDRLADTSDWLVAQWRAGAWIAANCTGTFILAQTGLLDGRTVTTTWWLERQFRAKYPKVDLQIRSVITESDRLVCAGASASYLQQAIRIIERHQAKQDAERIDQHRDHDITTISQIAKASSTVPAVSAARINRPWETGTLPIVSPVRPFTAM